MRKVVYGGACSLDGYLAREDDAVDWLIFDAEAGELIKEGWSRFDTMIMGRKTYEVGVRTMGSANPFGVETYVFSRTMDASDHKDIQLVSEDAGGFVRELKSSGGKDICVMGGGDFARTLFDEGLIDEVGFNIHPLLLGSGIPAFHRMAHQTDLELKECRALENGCVYVVYSVRH